MIIAIALALCQPGYAHNHRPTWKQTAPIKRQMLHGLPSRRYILDHIMPIELGGDGFDRANMQIQIKAAAHRKDLVENRLHRAVCSGRLNLVDAQSQMRAWK